METENPPWRPLTGAAGRRRRTLLLLALLCCTVSLRTLIFCFHITAMHIEVHDFLRNTAN